MRLTRTDMIVLDWYVLYIIGMQLFIIYVSLFQSLFSRVFEIRKYTTFP